MRTRNLLTVTGLTLAAAALVGCGPNLKAVDRHLDFGDTFVGTPVKRSTAWVNEGGQAHIGKIELSPGEAFSLDASEIQADPVLTRNERSGDVLVTFNPATAGVYESTLSLDSNGRADDVKLRGRGVYTFSPSGVSLSGDGLRWDEPLDHGSVPVAGGEAIRRVRVTNRTGRDVTLKPVWTRGDQGFELRDSRDEVRLARGDSVELTSVFDPDNVGTFQDSLMLIVDNDQTRGGLVVTGKGTR